VDRNIISGNGSVGVQLFGPTASGNIIQGNYIGLDITGTRAIPNGSDGVYLDNAPGNTIGGTATGAGNVISGNPSSGLQLFGDGTTGNVVQGNLLGTNASGTGTIANAYGLFINTPGANAIGGVAAGEANSIRGNGFSDIFTTPGFLSPTVQSVQLTTSGQSILGIVLTFSKSMNGTRAQSLKRYKVRLLGPRGSTVHLNSALYDPLRRTVTLVPAQPLSLDQTYRLSVNGERPGGLTDSSGNFLDGANNGQSGTNFIVSFGRGTNISTGSSTTSASAVAGILDVPPVPGHTARRTVAHRPRHR
jgi:hypothetical protein